MAFAIHSCTIETSLMTKGGCVGPDMAFRRSPTVISFSPFPFSLSGDSSFFRLTQRTSLPLEFPEHITKSRQKHPPNLQSGENLAYNGKYREKT
jgi:hypothetical protein